MQQPPSQNQNFNDSSMVLMQMMRQLDRLEERTRDLATRSDLEALRKELVARDSFEPQMSGLKAQIERVDADRIQDKKDANDRMDKMVTTQITQQDRLWIRLSQAAAFGAAILALFDFLSRFHTFP